MKNNKKTGQLFYKVVTAILLSVFILSPFGAVFADDTAPAPTTDTAAVSPDSTTDTTPTTSDTSTPPTTDTPPNDTASDTTTTPAPDTTTTTPDSSLSTTLSLTPSGSSQVTDQPQSSISAKNLAPQVSDSTGALEYSYPIVLPPGRNNMTPDLSLQYNSQNTQNNSVVGYGWNFSTPYIQVENKHGVDNLYTGVYNDYTTSDKGELGQISGSNYQLRSDDGSFDKYVLASNVWTVTAKTGLTYTYGSTTASQQNDSANPTHVYKWMLDSITDKNGNSIAYTYYKDQGQIYPNTITYTNLSGVSGPFVITFGRASVGTAFPASYTTGFAVTTQYRINTITTTISGTTRHVYALGYTTGDNTSRQLLSTVTETGYDVNSGVITLAPTKLKYLTNTTSGAAFTSSTDTMPTHALSDSSVQDARLEDAVQFGGPYVGSPTTTGTLIDVNGDGILDWVESENAGYAAGSTDNAKFYGVWLGTGTGWVQSTSWTSAMPKDSTGKTYQLTPYNYSSQNVHAELIDVNGDGLPDWVVTTLGSGSIVNSDTDAVWLNTGTGWTKSTTWTMPTYTTAGITYGVSLGYVGVGGPTGYTYSTDILDINGDGLPDIVQTTSDNFGTSTTSDHYAVWLNTGSGWTKSTTWTMPVHPKGDGTYYGSQVTQQDNDRIVDVNGDGLPDWIETIYSPTSNETYDVWMNTGTGWVRNTAWTLPVHTNTLPGGVVTSQGAPLGISNITCSGSVCGARSNTLADVNGDGLLDFVETTGDNVSSSEYQDVWLNNGKGWTKSTSWVMPAFGFPSTPIRLGNDGTWSSELSDINGDGLLDFVVSRDLENGGQPAEIFLNTGTGWNASGVAEPTRSDQGLYVGSVLGDTDYTQYPYIDIHRATELADVNGDGSPDWIESDQFNSIASGGYKRDKVWINPSSQSDLLSSVTYPHGGVVAVTYAPQVVVDKNATAQTQTVEVVASLTSTDGLGGTPAVTSYAYANGKYFYPTNGTWKKFAGFQKITATNPDGSKTINYYHQGNGIDTSTYEYSDDEYQIGKLYRTDITDSTNHLFKRTTTEWTTFPITSVNSNVAFVYPNQTITETFDGYATEKATAETWSYDTGTGNLLTDTNYGQVTATTPLTFTDTGSDEVITTDTYATNGSGMYLLDDQIKTNSALTKVWETQYYYDTLALGSLTLGNQTKVSQWKSGTTYASTQKSYNSNGTVATMTDGLGYITTNTTYDTNNLYPITVTDPLSHITHYTYDLMFGSVIQTTDPNSQIYTTNYDGLDRVLSTQIPDPATGTAVTRTTSSYDDEATGFSGRATSTTTASGITYYTEDYYDGLGRLVEEKRQLDPNNNPSSYQTTDYWYGVNGQISQQSLPYIDTGGSYNRGAGATTLNTTYTYDPMQRVLTTTNNLGTTANVYDDWKTTTTDPNGEVKNYYHDAYNNLSKVDEINSGTFTTTYSYNLNNLLIKITDAMGNVRAFGYDGLGNRTSAQDLHASADVTFGTSTYTYDLDNDLTRIVTPNSATINYTYDHTNRKLTEDWTGGTGTEITYAYDTCTQGVGRLCTVTMTSGANTSYTYDYDGNVASENKTINSNAFLTSYAHDLGGDIATITYPDSAVVQYNYISDGLLSSVQEKESGGSFANVVSVITYSPDLQISYMHYGNVDSTTNTYDATKLYRLTNKLSVDGTPSNIQNNSYTYDADGNITNLVDASIQDSSKTVAYTYDNLNRIKTATATGVHAGTTAYAETYTYDALGNILTKNGQTYLYQGNSGSSMANPDAPTSINSIGFTTNYDNDGNMINNGTLTNTYNYKDQMTQTVNGSTTVNYYYDQDGNRVWYNVGTTNTYYPNKYYNYDGTTKTKQIYIGNNLIGTFQTASGTMTPWYIMTDNILGTSLATSSTGAVKQVLDYLPFGDIRLNETWSTINDKNKFGGHQYDTETDLNYLGARYYSAPIGQFISQDPTTRDNPMSLLADPQQLNFYSYARDNPMTVVDLDGRMSLNPTDNRAYQNFATNLSNSSSLANSAISHPYLAGAAIAGGAGIIGGAGLLGSSIYGTAALISSVAPFAPQLSSEVEDGFQTLSAPEDSMLRFSQTSVSQNFDINGAFNGASRDSIIQGLTSGKIDPKEIPVNYLQNSNGLKLTENTRSLSTLLQAEVPESKMNLVPVEEGSDSFNRIMQHLTNNNLSSDGIKSVKLK